MSEGNIWASLRTYAMQAENVERVLLAMENQIRKFEELGWPAEATEWSESAVPGLRRIRNRLMRECGRLMKDTPLGEWAVSVHGLGDALFFTLGLMPAPLEGFATVSKAWRYSGLHVDGGRAVRREAGRRVYFSVRLRSYWLKRVAEPCVKQAVSPYRAVYLQRKSYTLETHPPMLTEDKALAYPGCEFCQRAVGKTGESRAARKLTRERLTVAFDCSNVGGAHWTDGHRHADALRVTAKAILRDAWRVAHGMEPKASAGGQISIDTQVKHAPALAAV